MARFIDPVYDTAFKLIFGQENSKELLLDFLNDLWEGGKKIKKLRFLDKERMPMYRRDGGVFTISPAGRKRGSTSSWRYRTRGTVSPMLPKIQIIPV